jgi:putative aminopeptidase FrvX
MKKGNGKNNETQYGLLKRMCAIHAPSGNETAMKAFLLEYIREHGKHWKHKPKLIHGKEFQDNLILVFGKPRTAIFAHTDSIGFTVRYGKQLVKIGGPVTKTGIRLTGRDSIGAQDATLQVVTHPKTKTTTLEYKAQRDFERGTELVFKADWREDAHHVQCCYLDNRLGVYSALKVAETLKHGAIVFSTWEEHGGGSVAYLQKYLFEKYGISQALISDISWISDGVRPGLGPVISLRDSLIPRRPYVERLIRIAREKDCAFQLEVEGSGGSDGRELQMAAYPWDWCFVGAAEENVHSPDEKVHKTDIGGMIRLYEVLMRGL